MSIVDALKTEISRVAKKEINKALSPIKRVNASQRTLIAKLRRELTELQKQISQLQRSGGAAVVESRPAKNKEEDGRRGAWMTGKGVRSLRKKIGVTQVELAKLADVSGQTVVNWEKTDGKIAFRQRITADRMQQIRKLTKKTAAKALAAESK